MLSKRGVEWEKKNLKKKAVTALYFFYFNNFIWSSFQITRKQNPVSALKQKFQVESLKTYPTIVS